MFFNNMKTVKKMDPSIKLYLCQSIQRSIDNIIVREKENKNYKIVNSFLIKKDANSKNINIILYGFSFFTLYTFFHIFFYKKNMYKYI